ncbi:hypothetical protein [Catellatospora tritici]|uniref:hypothetical protein n=1 Tax=Catellatospora tritici TaxID=2851566 RepID=UPI001C2DE1BA|nr:hypothetical protein [Catellatospora tritici]MBV1853751.1 hypothetical protein [Catellatospora tritici]
MTDSETRPAWADEPTAEWTLAERLRYDIAEFNDAQGFRSTAEPAWLTVPTGVYRAIAAGLRDS